MAKKDSEKKESKTTKASTESVNESSLDLEQIKKEIYEQVKQEVKAEKLDKPTEDSVSKPRKIQRKDSLDKQMLVPIMNVTNGKLIYQSRKTGSEFLFEKYGDIEYIELYELLTMRSSQRKFLDEPYVIVLDDEVADYLGLTKMYKKLTHATEIDRLFQLPHEQFEDVVESTPKGLAHLIISKAKEKIQTGELDSVQKVQVLEDKFNVELNS